MRCSFAPFKAAGVLPCVYGLHFCSSVSPAPSKAPPGRLLCTSLALCKRSLFCSLFPFPFVSLPLFSSFLLLLFPLLICLLLSPLLFYILFTCFNGIFSPFFYMFFSPQPFPSSSTPSYCFFSCSLLYFYSFTSSSHISYDFSHVFR